MEYIANFRAEGEYESRYSNRIEASSIEEALAKLRTDAETDLIEILECEMHLLN